MSGVDGNTALLLHLDGDVQNAGQAGTAVANTGVPFQTRRNLAKAAYLEAANTSRPGMRTTWPWGPGISQLIGGSTGRQTGIQARYITGA